MAEDEGEEEWLQEEGEEGEGEGELDTMGFFIAKFRKTAHYADDFAWGRDTAEGVI